MMFQCELCDRLPSRWKKHPQNQDPIVPELPFILPLMKTCHQDGERVRRIQCQWSGR